MTQADTLKESTLTKLTAKEINGTQAAEILKLSTRQVRRLKKRFKIRGHDPFIFLVFLLVLQYIVNQTFLSFCLPRRLLLMACFLIVIDE